MKLGRLLQLERERKGKRLPDLSESLKISEENLQYIEAGESHKLPAELYFKMFSKSYAEALGIDYEATIQAINDDIAEQKAATATPEKEKARRAAEEARRVQEAKYGFRKKLIWTFAGILVAMVVFIFAYRIFVSGPSATVGDQSGSPDSQVESVSAALAEYDFGEPPSDAPDPIKITFRARSESWATVLADGDTVIFRSLVPWRVYEVEAKYRVLVSVAHPSVVDITLNGASVDIRDPESQRISRVEIDQVNVRDMMERTVSETSTSGAPARPDRQSQPTQPAQPSAPQQPSHQNPSPAQDTGRTAASTPGGGGERGASGGTDGR